MNAPDTAPGAGRAADGRVGRDPPDQAQLRQLAEEQAALRRVATLVAGAAAPEEVLAAVASEVGTLLAVDYTALMRSDPEDMITVVGTWTGTGAAAPSPVGSRFQLGGRNMSTLVLRTGRPVRLDAYDDVSGTIGATGARVWGFRSSVGAPISVDGRPWGLILVAYTREEPLPADTEARLAGFTELVATAIANSQARVELRGFAEEQAALRRVATLVARGAAPEEVFTAVLEEVGRLLPINQASWAATSPTRTATCVAHLAYGRRPVFPVGSRWPLGGHNLDTLVFQTGRPARIDHYADSASGPIGAAHRAAGARSAVGAPVIVEGRLWGMIHAGSTLRGSRCPRTPRRAWSPSPSWSATASPTPRASAALLASRARIVAAADTTRRRIERDLHDGTQQQLVSLDAGPAGGADSGAPATRRAGGPDCRTSPIGSRACLTRCGRSPTESIPAILSEGGLTPALKALARRSAVPVELDLTRTAAARTGRGRGLLRVITRR